MILAKYRDTNVKGKLALVIDLNGNLVLSDSHKVVEGAIGQFAKIIRDHKNEYYNPAEPEKAEEFRRNLRFYVTGGNEEQRIQVHRDMCNRFVNATNQDINGTAPRMTREQKAVKVLKIVGKAAAYTTVCIAADLFIPGLGVAIGAVGTAAGAIKGHSATITAETTDITNAQVTMETNKLGYSLVTSGSVSPSDPTYGPQYTAYLAAQTEVTQSSSAIGTANQGIANQNNALWGTGGRFWEGAVWKSGVGMASIGLSIYAGFKLGKGIYNHVKAKHAKRDMKEIVDFIKSVPEKEGRPSLLQIYTNLNTKTADVTR
jgi:hypothetical protein